MAVKTKAEIKSQVDTIIKVNGNREITPPKHNSILTNVIDSFVNIKDGAVMDALLSYSYNPSFINDGDIVTKKFVDDAISGLTTGLTYQGTWDADTNTPALASGVGTNGYYYIVNVAGTTSIDGVNDWEVGDWILFNGTAWQKIDQSTKWSDGYPTYDLRYQGISDNLTSLSALSYASTSFVKMTAAGTFALDTNTYASASDLTSYAKLDGTNMPFTGNNNISNTLPSLSLTATGTYPAFGSNYGLLFKDSSSNIRASILSYSFGSVYKIGLKTQEIFTISDTVIFGTNIGNTITTFTSSTGNWNFAGTSNVNKITLNGSIKIANNTQTAAAAGAGSIRYNSGLEVSDGATWVAVGGATILSNTASIIEASWSGNTDYEYSVTVTGAAIGDFCLIQPDEDVFAEINTAGAEWQGYAYCTAANTVTVICRVSSFITIPASSIFTIKVIK